LTKQKPYDLSPKNKHPSTTPRDSTEPKNLSNYSQDSNPLHIYPFVYEK
jgi:hypothetical protein